MTSTLSISPTSWPLRAQPARDVPASAAQAAPCTAGFILFLLVNAVLFIQPSEFIPDIKGLELYYYLIVPCLLLSFPVLMQQFSLRSLQATPTTVGVLLFLLAVALSNFVNLDVAEGWDNGVTFLKVTLYYLLLIGLVTTPGRLRGFLWWMPIFCTVIGLLTVLQFHQIINLPGKWSVTEQVWDMTLQRNVNVVRLMSTGVFADPNEFCLLMTVCLILSLYWLTDSRSGFMSLLWLLPAGLFFYAITLTQSRGGLLAFLAGAVVFFRARFGWFNTLVLGALGLPVLLVLVGGRMAGVSVGANTAQDRIGRWADAFMEFKTSPLFGIGCMQFSKNPGELVAHNSYLHAFTELGVFGGVLFLGMFGFVLLRMLRFTTGGRSIADPTLRRLLPFVTAVLACYAAGMLFLSLNYVIPTFAVLGVATAYLNMTRSDPPLPESRFDTGWVLTWTLASGMFLVALNLFVKMFVSR